MSDTPSIDFNTSPGVTTQLRPLNSANAPGIAPTVVEQSKNLSEASRAALMQTYERSHGKAAVDAAFGQKQAPAPVIARDGEVSAGKLFPGAGVSDKAAEGAVEKLIASWTGDPQHLRNELGRLGVTKQAVTNTPSLPVAAPVDNAMTDPPASSADYKTDWVNLEGFTDLPTEQLAKLDGEMRQAMHAIGLPKATGGSIFRAAVENANKIAQMRSPAEIHEHEQTQLALLKNAVGSGEQYEKTIEKAAASFLRIPEATRVRMLAAKMPKSAAFLLEMARAEDRYQARTKTV